MSLSYGTRLRETLRKHAPAPSGWAGETVKRDRWIELVIDDLRDAGLLAEDPE